MHAEHTGQNAQPESQPVATGPPPPPQAAAGPPEERTAWPIVLGIIALIFGGFGLISNLFGAVSPFLFEGIMTSLAGNLPGEAQESMQASMEVARAWRTWSVGFALVSVLVSAMLLVGGILLMMRRASAAQLLKLWSVARIFTAVVGAYVAFRIQQATFAAMRGSIAEEMDQVPETFIAAFAMFSNVFSLLFGCALPVFMLIWFARQAIKDEVACWI